jgi:hypothetical protein
MTDLINKGKGPAEPQEQGAAQDLKQSSRSSLTMSSDDDNLAPVASAQITLEDVKNAPLDLQENSFIKIMNDQNFFLEVCNYYKIKKENPVLFRQLGNGLLLDFKLPHYAQEEFNQRITHFFKLLSSQAAKDNNKYFGLGTLLLNLLFRANIQTLLMPQGDELVIDCLFKILDINTYTASDINENSDFLNNLLNVIYQASPAEIKNFIRPVNQDIALESNEPLMLWEQFNGFKGIIELYNIDTVEFLEQPLKALLLSFTQNIAENTTAPISQILKNDSWMISPNQLYETLVISPSEQTCLLRAKSQNGRDDNKNTYSWKLFTWVTGRVPTEAFLMAEDFSIMTEAKLVWENDSNEISYNNGLGFKLNNIRFMGPLASAARELYLNSGSDEMRKGLVEFLTLDVSLPPAPTYHFNKGNPSSSSKPKDAVPSILAAPTPAAKVVSNAQEAETIRPKVLVAYAAVATFCLLATPLVAAFIIPIALTGVLHFLMAGTFALLVGAVVIDGIGAAAEAITRKLNSNDNNDPAPNEVESSSNQANNEHDNDIVEEVSPQNARRAKLSQAIQDANKKAEDVPSFANGHKSRRTNTGLVALLTCFCGTRIEKSRPPVNCKPLEKGVQPITPPSSSISV